MAASQIEWTESTWNPVAGCTVLSPGCKKCYAMRMAARLEVMGQAKYKGTTRRSGGRSVWSGRINIDWRTLHAPVKWSRPQRIFVNSMSDLFHEDVPIEVVREVWGVMEQADWHTFQILTKRPFRMRQSIDEMGLRTLPNVWLGTSVENASYAWRIDLLRRVPAVVRFVSFEPLIGAVGHVDLSEVDWAIVGGESGPGARPMKADWVEEILKATRQQGVAFFFKQWGGVRKKTTGRLLDGRTWDEYPSLQGRKSVATTRPLAAA